MLNMNNPGSESDVQDAKCKPKSRKRYEIPKTATCNVCGKFISVHIVWYLFKKLLWNNFICSQETLLLNIYIMVELLVTVAERSSGQTIKI